MQDREISENGFCRNVTSDEIAHYQEFGWVKLKRFVQPEIIQLLLNTAQQKMGDDGDSNAAYGINQPYFNAEYCGGLRPLTDSAGELKTPGNCWSIHQTKWA